MWQLNGLTQKRFALCLIKNAPTAYSTPPPANAIAFLLTVRMRAVIVLIPLDIVVAIHGNHVHVVLTVLGG